MAGLKKELKSSVYGTSKRKSGHGFSRKCASLVKEQRARIYILRRCATMLLCWAQGRREVYGCIPPLFTEPPGKQPCKNSDAADMAGFSSSSSTLL
ncbi:hypothetical protein CsSME_00051896 [Camellia sinensis var. sinensis]